MTNLLLLLSAMLSALIGAGPVGRVAEAPAVAVAGGAVRDQTLVAPLRAVVARPSHAWAVLVVLLTLGGVVVLRIPAIVPAWANRRRE